MGRNEVGVGDEGFLTSMIPHHSRAILVCQEASITDPEVEQLCSESVEAQEREIDQMKEILKRYQGVEAAAGHSDRTTRPPQ